jgi:hypothetical protein
MSPIQASRDNLGHFTSSERQFVANSTTYPATGLQTGTPRRNLSPRLSARNLRAGERIRTADLPLTRGIRSVAGCRWPSPDTPSSCINRRSWSPWVRSPAACVGSLFGSLRPVVRPSPGYIFLASPIASAATAYSCSDDSSPMMQRAPAGPVDRLPWARAGLSAPRGCCGARWPAAFTASRRW